MKLNITFNGETKAVNFTQPQAEIMMRLLRGDKVTYINTHRMSGGEFVWYDENGYECGANCVGVKAFNGAMWAICKAFNLNDEQTIRLYDQYIVK